MTELGVPRCPMAVMGESGSYTCHYLSSVQWLFEKCSLTNQMMLCPVQILPRLYSSPWTTSIGSSGRTPRVAMARWGEAGLGLWGVRGKEVGAPRASAWTSDFLLKVQIQLEVGRGPEKFASDTYHSGQCPCPPSPGPEGTARPGSAGDREGTVILTF